MSIFLYGWVEFAVLYSVNRMLFRTVVLIFVELSGGGEWPDVIFCDKRSLRQFTVILVSNEQ